VKFILLHDAQRRERGLFDESNVDFLALWKLDKINYFFSIYINSPSPAAVKHEIK